MIYDRCKQRYVAVFNERKVRVWSEDETDLNSVKGHKFQSSLYAILPRDDALPVLVQQSGATASLEWALENRKTWTSKGILRTNEKLLNCKLIELNGKFSLFCLTKIEDVHICVVYRLEDETCLEKADTVRRIELKRRSEDLAGHAVVHYRNNAYLLTLCTSAYHRSIRLCLHTFLSCVRSTRVHSITLIVSGSHGRLYSHFLMGTSADPESSKLISVIANINTKYPVVMTHLNETTIAIYGADVTDEGAVLMIYNVQFKLAQAAQKLKLYTIDAKLWKLEDKLLLAANRHLAVAPYHVAPQRISAMLGSSLNFRNESSGKDADDIMVIQDAMVAQWDRPSGSRARVKSSSIGRIPSSISKQVHVYLNEAWSDAAIQEALIPNLIESKDVASIRWCLDTFKGLPEKLLVELLAFALKSPDEVFVPVQNGTSDDLSKASSGSYPRNDFLARVLSIEYSGVSLLPHLKTGLIFDEVLKLLEYLKHKLSEKTKSLDDNPQPSDHQLYEWSCALLDSHYQHYLLSQDVYVLKLFNQFNSILEEHVSVKRATRDVAFCIAPSFC